jgi:hypothetical protein
MIINIPFLSQSFCIFVKIHRLLFPLLILGAGIAHKVRMCLYNELQNINSFCHA